MGVVVVASTGCSAPQMAEGVAQEVVSEETSIPQEASQSREQPIAFPHDVHAGDYQIDCQYCHFSAERSESAGIPPVATCMGCHTIVAGQENPQEIEKLREYWNNREAIPWVRIYKVSDHVHFPHMRHVAAGVDCTSCHGAVQEIGVIEELNQPLSMGWCLNCHMERGVSRDCTVCHY